MHKYTQQSVESVLLYCKTPQRTVLFISTVQLYVCHCKQSNTK